MEVLRRLPGVIITALLLAVAAVFGFIGSPNRGERFDAKTIVLEPAADGGLRITEFVDIDFGHVQRHGYERVLRTDFGWPIDIEAYSATVSDQVFTDPDSGTFGIRVGDPNVEVDGRHRFVLAYTLPLAPMDDDFNLSVIDPGEDFETGRFTVVLDGFRLDDAVCSVGGLGDVGGCELTDGDVGQQVVFEPLAAGAGVNLSGSAVITGEPLGVDPGPEIPPIEDPSTIWRAFVAGLAAAAAGVWVVARGIRRGSNEVAAVDAGGAAYPVAGSPTIRVTDDQLLAMATTEFAPPDGVAPWEGRVLIDERVGDQTVSAWLSSQLGTGVLVADETNDGVVLTRTATPPTPDDEPLLAALVTGQSREIPKKYSAAFAATWTATEKALSARIESRQWWTRMGVAMSRRRSSVVSVILGIGLGAGAGIVGVTLRFTGSPVGAVTGNPFAMVIASALLGALVGVVATLGDRGARTAIGSAAFLRTESFRRFLAASEATHVEQALERGVLREYTAWAVALGEAEAWERAAKALGNAVALSTVTSTAFLYHHRSTFSSATTAPSSSGGHGGGGVGGGGGGGRSGSW